MRKLEVGNGGRNGFDKPDKGQRGVSEPLREGRRYAGENRSGDGEPEDDGQQRKDDEVGDEASEGEYIEGEDGGWQREYLHGEYRRESFTQKTGAGFHILGDRLSEQQQRRDTEIRELETGHEDDIGVVDAKKKGGESEGRRSIGFALEPFCGEIEGDHSGSSQTGDAGSCDEGEEEDGRQSNDNARAVVAGDEAQCIGEGDVDDADMDSGDGEDVCGAGFEERSAGFVVDPVSIAKPDSKDEGQGFGGGGLCETFREELTNLGCPRGNAPGGGRAETLDGVRAAKTHGGMHALKSVVFFYTANPVVHLLNGGEQRTGQSDRLAVNERCVGVRPAHEDFAVESVFLLLDDDLGYPELELGIVVLREENVGAGDDSVDRVLRIFGLGEDESLEFVARWARVACP